MANPLIFTDAEHEEFMKQQAAFYERHPELLTEEMLDAEADYQDSLERLLESWG